jgi:hypothetical protein
MAITIKIACNDFVKAVMENEFSEQEIISFKSDDWWSEIVFEHLRKPRVGEAMPPIPEGSKFIEFYIPDRIVKAGRTYLPVRFRDGFIRAIEKFGKKAIKKSIQSYLNTEKYTLKDCIWMSLEAYGLGDDDKAFGAYHRAYFRKRPSDKKSKEK